MDKDITSMSLREILSYAEEKAEELIEKETDREFDRAYDAGFDDGFEAAYRKAAEIILDWIKDNQAKMLSGLKEGLEKSGVAGEIRNIKVKVE